MGCSSKGLKTGSHYHLSIEDENMEKNENLKIKNPFVKLGTYLLLAMVVGIGVSWILLGIVSPVLLILLIQRW